MPIFYCLYKMRHAKYIKKHFYRFLKERGVFSAYLKRREYEDDTIEIGCDPYYWLQSSVYFCAWTYTEEGTFFWAAINYLWQYQCIKNNFTNESASPVLSFLNSIHEKINMGAWWKYSTVNGKIISKLNQEIEHICEMENN